MRKPILAMSALLALLAAGPLQAQDAPPPRPLDVLRTEIDRVDGEILALLNARAAIVDEVGRGKAGANAVVFRPGRQAALIRKLAAVQGRQKPATIARVWTAVIAGSILQQKADFSVSVADAGDGATELLAQDYFGAQMPRQRLASADAAIAAVSEHRADVAVVRLDGPWWNRLPEGMHVVAAVPFVAPSEKAPAAYIVARQDIDPSGDDVTLVRLPADVAPDGAQQLAADGGFKLWAFAKGAPLPTNAEPIGIHARPLVIGGTDKTPAPK